MSAAPAADVERAFVIADLAGYTALTEAMGGVEAARVVSRYVELAEQAVHPGATLLEQVGDQVLVVAHDAASAVKTAVALCHAVRAEPLFPNVRAGVHGGPVVERAGRYFGPALNVTARVAAHARAGQLLCTERIAAAADLPAIEYRRLGPVRFRNVVEPVSVFEIVTASEDSAASAIDPVCRMQVRPDTAPARLPYGDTTYYFCSFECARQFAQRPDEYAATSGGPNDR